MTLLTSQSSRPVLLNSCFASSIVVKQYNISVRKCWKNICKAFLFTTRTGKLTGGMLSLCSTPQQLMLCLSFNINVIEWSHPTHSIWIFHVKELIRFAYLKVSQWRCENILELLCSLFCMLSTVSKLVSSNQWPCFVVHQGSFFYKFKERPRLNFYIFNCLFSLTFLSFT